LSSVRYEAVEKRFGLVTVLRELNLDVPDHAFLALLGPSGCGKTTALRLLAGLDLPIVGDLRGTGFFYALELVKDKETRQTFDDDECEDLLRGFLSPQLFERGLICRADDRGDPVIQISPPLIAGKTEFDTIAGTLGEVLEEAWRRLR